MHPSGELPWAYFPALLPVPGALPIGAVLTYAGPLATSDTQPPGLNLAEVTTRLAAAGWLPCDGRSLSCGDYALLYGVIGKAFGGDGTHFNLPDLRGRFVRGVDGGEGRDPSAAKRTASNKGGNSGDQVGSLQSDAYQGHEHDYSAANTSIVVQPGETTVFGPAEITQATTGQIADTAGNGTPRVDKETRPVNLYLNYIIRYK